MSDDEINETVKGEKEKSKLKKANGKKNIFIGIFIGIFIIAPLALGLIGLIVYKMFTVKTLEILEKNQVIKEVKLKEDNKDNENIIEQESKFVPKEYLLKAGRYEFVENGPEREEITRKEWDDKIVKVTRLNIEPGIYSIELIKGDNVHVYHGTLTQGVGFSLKLTKTHNKYDEVYFSKEMSTEHTPEEMNIYSTLYIYIEENNGEKYNYDADVTIKLTKVNKKIGEEPKTDNETNKKILTEKGLYENPYIIGEELLPGIYDVICLEGSAGHELKVKTVSKDEERFIMEISAEKVNPETPYIRALRLETGDELYFGIRPMGFEGMDEDFELPVIIPLKLLFIRR